VFTGNATTFQQHQTSRGMLYFLQGKKAIFMVGVPLGVGRSGGI
jgi:hypothetical protein